VSSVYAGRLEGAEPEEGRGALNFGLPAGPFDRFWSGADFFALPAGAMSGLASPLSSPSSSKLARNLANLGSFAAEGFGLVFEPVFRPLAKVMENSSVLLLLGVGFGAGGSTSSISMSSGGFWGLDLAEALAKREVESGELLTSSISSSSFNPAKKRANLGSVEGLLCGLMDLETLADFPLAKEIRGIGGPEEESFELESNIWSSCIDLESSSSSRLAKKRRSRGSEAVEDLGKLELAPCFFPLPDVNKDVSELFFTAQITIK